VLITPVPGVNRDHLLTTLAHLHTGAINASSESQLTSYHSYLQWTDEAVKKLRNQIRAADIARLVLTRRHELLLTATDPKVIQLLLRLELDERVRAFEEAQAALRAEVERWSGPGVLVVADTTVYINHPRKLEELDFWTELGIHHEPVHLIVPIAVVDELDNLKDRGPDKARGRARVTLATLDRVIATVPGAVLRDRDLTQRDSSGRPRAAVTLELLLDPPGHARLPITDDEIIDRAMSVQLLAGRPVTLLTYDTGQAMRGRAAELKVIKLNSPGSETR
jgi:hypothetical protein